MQRLARVAFRRGWVLGVGLMASACTDNSTGPLGLNAAPATISAWAGDGQSANVGTTVTTAPAVKVTSASGAAVAGVTVRFSVLSGGGSIANASAVTDSRGIAGPGSWTLGPSTGENVLQASVAGLTALQFTATATSAFDLTVRYLGVASAEERSAVDAAVATWRSAILGDLTDVRITAPANECFPGQPATDEVVDDLVLYVQVARIDGAGQVLAESGPCYTRSSSSLPAMGVLILDSDDIANMQTEGLLHDLVAHEIGHVLGFGTIWPDLGLLSGAGGPDPRFLGSSAVGAFQVLGGGAAGVPVENQGTDGTRDSHWRESVFGNELMTGYINRGSNPLSALSIASLHDLGYVTDGKVANAYALPLAGVRAPGEVQGNQVEMSTSEVLITPRRRVGG